MGSSKKSKQRKGHRVDVRTDDVSDGRRVAVEREGEREGERVGERDESAARVAHAVGQLDARLTAIEQQLERTLVLQQRTNTLLELLAGSAFDLELGGGEPH